MVSRFEVVVALFLITNIVFSHLDDGHTQKNKIHKCVHDTFEKQIIHQNVKYSDRHNDHILNDGVDRRKLVQESDYEAIRISPYYDSSTISTSNGLTTDQINYIKALVSSSIRYFESFVRVIPVDGPLYVSPCTSWGMADDRSFIYPFCEQSGIDGKCGDYVTIPDDHMPDTYYYDKTTQTSTLYKSSGAGIANTDLVIYVTYINSAGKCASGDVLAFAGACNRDQYGRPIAGSINFCSATLSDEYWLFDAYTTLHELTHVLIMSTGLFGTFYDHDTGSFYGASNVVDSVSDLYNSWIITDKVKEVSREYFDCSSLKGAALENAGGVSTAGSHWEQKYLNFELMQGTIYSAQNYVSIFTLALMEDSGWYLINYNYAETLTWGKNEGCDFFNTACIDKTTHTSNFEQFWCDNENDDGCTADYSSIGECLLFPESPPSEFKYYTDGWGGPESHDYCGFKDPYTSNTNFERICWDSRGNTLDTASPIGASTYSLDSRCVDVNTDGGNQEAYCFKNECFGFNSNTSIYDGINITVNTNEFIICERTDILNTKSVTSISGIASIVCPDIDAICGHSTLPFQCYWGQYNDKLSKCLCKVGYIGTLCDTKDNTIFVDEAEAASTTTTTSLSYSSVCIQGISGYTSFLNGRYKVQGTNEGVVAFYNDSINNGVYVFFQRYGSEWRFGTSLGGMSIFGSCDQYIDQNTIPNIEQCKTWKFLDESRDFVPQTGVTAIYDGDQCGDDVDDANSFSMNSWIKCGFILFSFFSVFT